MNIKLHVNVKAKMIMCHLLANCLFQFFLKQVSTSKNLIVHSGCFKNADLHWKLAKKAYPHCRLLHLLTYDALKLYKLN